MRPGQIVFPIIDFKDSDGDPVDVTGFPITCRSLDDSIAKWDKFDRDGRRNPEGEFAVESLAVGTVQVEYAVENPDLTVATKTGSVVIALDDAINSPLSFSEPIDVVRT